MTTTEEQLEFYVKNNPQFEAKLIGSESPINTNRTSATDCLNRCKDLKPDDFICQLLRILKDKKSSKELRRLSAIQLCHIDIVMPRLADSTLNILKTTLIFSLENENEKFVSEKVCEAVSLIAPALLTKKAWPDLLDTLVEWLISSFSKPRNIYFVSEVTDKLQKLALLIFAQFGHNMREALSPYFTLIFCRGVFDCFMSLELDVRFAALSAAINLMQYSDRFEVFVPNIMNTLTETLECYEDAMAEEALKLLIELGRMKPSVFHRQLVDVIELMIKIMENFSYEEGPRHLAIEFVIQLVEARELAEGNLPLNSINRLVAVLLKMFLETDDEDTGDTSTYAFYLEHLNKLLVSNVDVDVVELMVKIMEGPRHLAIEFVRQLVKASRLSINLRLNLQKPRNRYMFMDFVPSIMDTLTEALKCRQEAMAQEALNLLIELASMWPSVFRGQLADVVERMVKIMEADGFEESTRHLAIEFVIQLAEAREFAEGNLPLNSINRLVAVLLKMFLETDDEDTGDTSTYAFYLEHLNKLLVSLGGDSILPVASGPEFQKSQIVVNMIKRFREVILIIHGRRLPEATSHSHLSPSCTVIILNRLLISS